MAYVLIVDDDEDYANMSAVVLREAGHEVGIELHPNSAMRSMEARRPDLVVLDVMFPEGSSAGFEMARTMQHNNERLRGILILMLTSVDERFPLGFGPDDIDDAFLPVADFLEKPVDPAVLREKVSALLQRAGGRGET